MKGLEKFQYFDESQFQENEKYVKLSVSYYYFFSCCIFQTFLFDVYVLGRRSNSSGDLGCLLYHPRLWCTRYFIRSWVVSLIIHVFCVPGSSLDFWLSHVLSVLDTSFDFCQSLLSTFQVYKVDSCRYHSLLW